MSASYIVYFKEGVTKETRDTHVSHHKVFSKIFSNFLVFRGNENKQISPIHLYDTLSIGYAAKLTDEQKQQVEKDPNVKFVEKDQEMKI